jgi:hypothetical protein
MLCSVLDMLQSRMDVRNQRFHFHLETESIIHSHPVIDLPQLMVALQGLKPLDEILFECVHILKRLVVKVFFA